MLHEFSHYIACLATGVKVHEAKFFGISEAYVKHATPSLSQSIVITLAPFFISNFLGILLIREAGTLLSSYFLASLVFYWIGVSGIYFSFPSDRDAKNSYDALVSFCKKKLLRGALPLRLAWLMAMPFIFFPLLVVLAGVLFFNYLIFLRLIWLFFIFSISF